MAPLEALLAARTVKTATCWLYQGPTNGRGYGQVFAGGRRAYAHRLSYELNCGPIPADKELDHLCRVRNCVRPSHLEPVTHRENTLRGHTIAARRAAQTACIHGHPFDVANTLVLRDGTRSCRACRARRMREIRAAARAA
jgi:hypothetical protein